MSEDSIVTTYHYYCKRCLQRFEKKDEALVHSCLVFESDLEEIPNEVPDEIVFTRSSYEGEK